MFIKVKNISLTSVLFRDAARTRNNLTPKYILIIKKYS